MKFTAGCWNKMWIRKIDKKEEETFFFNGNVSKKVLHIKLKYDCSKGMVDTQQTKKTQIKL